MVLNSIFNQNYVKILGTLKTKMKLHKTVASTPRRTQHPNIPNRVENTNRSAVQKDNFGFSLENLLKHYK